MVDVWEPGWCYEHIKARAWTIKGVLKAVNEQKEEKTQKALEGETCGNFKVAICFQITSDVTTSVKNWMKKLTEGFSTHIIKLKESSVNF